MSVDLLYSKENFRIYFFNDFSKMSNNAKNSQTFFPQLLCLHLKSDLSFLNVNFWIHKSFVITACLIFINFPLLQFDYFFRFFKYFFLLKILNDNLVWSCVLLLIYNLCVNLCFPPENTRIIETIASW